MGKWTKEPWGQGMLLPTAQVRGMSKEARRELDEDERVRTYSNFHAEDGGHSREFVALFRYEADLIRANACVNACKGIEDPAKALQAAGDALEECVKRLDGVDAPIFERANIALVLLGAK